MRASELYELYRLLEPEPLTLTRFGHTLGTQYTPSVRKLGLEYYDIDHDMLRRQLEYFRAYDAGASLV
jgi:hypothetical protein